MAYQLAIIGAGNMAEAIARGLLRGGVFRPEQIVAADISPQRRQLFAESLSIETLADPAGAAAGVPLVLLSVKPQQMKDVLAALAPAIGNDTLVVSIAAGISTRFIEQQLSPKPVRVIRTMPNTPMLVGEGMVAVAPGSRATRADVDQARRLFAPAADVIDLSEDKIDAVTALSGSGPAYFFYLVEQMVRAGTELGLSADEARRLATRTAAGAARMLLGCADSPQELRRKVTSPGGTTQAAITHMEQQNVGQTVVDAIRAAWKRSRELGS